MAEEISNPKGVNIILLGTVSTLLEPEEALWTDTISDMLPAKIRDRNIEGFRRGRRVKVG